MAYADLGKVNTLMNGQLKKRTYKKLAVVCAEKADGIVDAYVATRFVVPFSPTPALIESIAQDLTLYYLFRTGFFDGVAGNDKEMIEAIWADAIKQLELIRDGEIELPDADPSNVGANAARIASTRGEFHSSMDMGDERDWGPDKDLIEQIEDEKA